MSAHRITRGFAWNHLYKLAEFGGINLYAIMVARAFGPEVGGNYAVYLSISGTVAMIGAFAVDGVLLRYLPRILRGERSFGEAKVEGIRPFLIELLAFRLFVNLCLALLVVLVLAVLPNYSSDLAASLGNIRALWPWLTIFLFAQAAVAFSTYTLIGLLQTKWVFFASLFGRLALLGVGALLLATGHISIEGAVALHAFSALFIATLLLYWVHHHVERETSLGLRLEFANFRRRLTGFISKPSRVRIFLLMPFMLYGITTWGSDILSTVLGRQPDILMMRALLGENARDIGLYDAAARLGLMTEYIVLFGLGGTLVSVFSEFAQEDERKSSEALAAGGGKPGSPPRGVAYRRLQKGREDIAGFQTLSTAPPFIFMLAFAPLVMQVLYGAKFSGAVPMLVASLLLQAITVIAFGGGMQVTSLVVIGKERFVFVNRLAWGILNLVVNYFLILHYGGLGAMIGTQAANLGVVATESFAASRWIGPCLRLWRSAAILAIAAGSTLVTYFGSSFLGAAIPSLVRLILTGICMALLIIAGYTLFRIPEARKAWSKIRSLMGRPEEIADEAATLSV
ncbi:MAG TPA: oligosaccharide flippase family protein [Candidatus Kapabacteria bacterium]|nr:oligosaccharide flippase family protein [Candidatus Kapabacteria bacterium]